MDGATMWIVLGAVAGGFVQGLSGFAFGLVAMGFWAWTVSPPLAASMVVFGSLLGQVLSLGTVRRAFDLDRALPLVIGGAFGVPLGVWLLRLVDPTAFKIAIGAFLSIYCPAVLLFRELPRIRGGGRLADGGAGFVGGVMGGLAGLTGPAPVLWCALRGWSSDAQRAAFQTFNIAAQALTLAMYAATGVLTGETGRMFLLVGPAMLVPTLLGVRLYRRFSDTAFRRLVLLLLTAAGVALLALSVPQLAR